MAKVDVEIPTDLIRKLEKLGSSGDEISKKMLKTGADIVKRKIDSNLKKNLYENRPNSKHYPTGALERSITADKPKKNKRGNHYVRIYFKGKDSKGTANAIKARAMESGTSKQQKKPFLRPAVNETKDKVNAEMQKIFDEEMKRLEG